MEKYKTISTGSGLDSNLVTEKDNVRIAELKKQINKYDIQYYEDGISDISDAEYDRLYDEYIEFEKIYPNLANMDDAPSKRIGAGTESGTTTGLQKFTHKSPLLSIDRKAKELSELKDFYEKCGGEGTEVIIEPKLDGITCNINYENGKFVNAATRGNGYIGDLISNNFKMTDTTYAEEIAEGKDLEVRGEAIIPLDYFKSHLIDDYSNPRNAVAGILRQLNPKDVKEKGIQVMFYDIGHTDITLVDEDLSNIYTLKTLGFQVIPVEAVNTWKELKEVVETRMHDSIQNIDGFNVLMTDGKFPQAVCDGLVIKVNSRKKREEIGMSEKGPKWAFAYKFKPLQAETRIDHIEWQVGKSGRVTPVAIFDEINLGGTKITRATLNNFDYMQKLPVLCESRDVWINESYDNWGSREDIYYSQPLDTDHIDVIREGDLLIDKYPERSQMELNSLRVGKISENRDGFWIEDKLYGGEWYPFEKNRYCLVNENPCLQMDDKILVERSNDVIPRIVAIAKHQNCIYQDDMATTERLYQRRKTFDVPTHCPDCGQPLSNQYPLLYCTSSLCPSQITGKISHFASRDAMNIIGLGEGVIEVLYKEGFLTSIPSLYHLKDYSDKLKELDFFGTRKVKKLLKAIEDSKNPELWQFIYSLSIEGVGRRASKDLAQRYHTLDNFLNASIDELLLLEDMGEITSKSIVSYISNESALEMIYELVSLGINPKPIEIDGEKLKGKTFVITGTLSQPRKYYQEIIEKNGGKVSGSVSKKTTAVLIGANAGSKEEKARKLVSEGNIIELLDTENKIVSYFDIEKKYEM